MAGAALTTVRSPTLLIVGSEDHIVLDLNRLALEQLQAPASLEIVPGATHVFEEPGAMQEVIRLACAWFGHYLTGAPA